MATHTFTHSYTNTNTNTNTHTHARAHTHTHTHTHRFWKARVSFSIASAVKLIQVSLPAPPRVYLTDQCRYRCGGQPKDSD